MPLQEEEGTDTLLSMHPGSGSGPVFVVVVAVRVRAASTVARGL